MTAVLAAIQATRPIDWFRIEDALNSREKVVEPGSIRELCFSIVANGLLQAVGAIDHGEYGIPIYGFRRLEAIGYGLSQNLAVPVDIPVVLYPLTTTSSKVKVINLTENLQRLDLTDPQIYRACKALMELNPDWQRKDLAAHLSKDASTVTRYLCPDGLKPEAMQLFMEGKFGFTKAYAIVKSPDQNAALALFDGNATVAELDSNRQRVEHDPNAAAEKVKADSIKVVVGGVTVTIKKRGYLSLDDAIKQLPEALKELERAKKAGHDARTLAALMRKKAKAT